MNLGRTRRGLRAALACLLALTSGGCYRVTVVDGPNLSTREHTEWAHFFLYGVLGRAAVDARNDCDGQAAMIVRKEDPLTALVSVVTAGIYTPARITIACKKDADPTLANAPSRERARSAQAAESR